MHRIGRCGGWSPDDVGDHSSTSSCGSRLHAGCALLCLQPVRTTVVLTRFSRNQLVTSLFVPTCRRKHSEPEPKFPFFEDSLRFFPPPCARLPFPRFRRWEVFARSSLPFPIAAFIVSGLRTKEQTTREKELENAQHFCESGPQHCIFARRWQHYLRE